MIKILLLALLALDAAGGEAKLEARIFRPVATTPITESEWEDAENSCSIYCALGEVVVAATNDSGTKVGQHAHDFRLATAWKGLLPARGARLEYTVDTQFSESADLAITELIVVNGDESGSTAPVDSARVKTVAMSVNGTTLALIEFANESGVQRVPIPHITLKPKAKTKIVFELLTTYPTEDAGEFAITELEFDGVGHH